jgi:hypothetical protein
MPGLVTNEKKKAEKYSATLLKAQFPSFSTHLKKTIVDFRL